ncbi:hypothetical protein COU62_04420 [Candidatus Pacearchaeota archaeon CG10_big_fil_rev_8_21_14_0_10_35_219]|nr:NUDIX hydrolase [Candidatus Pacearchaeota archaeon]OIO42089.1 MAG: hypothetical protein AUJ63_04050 [Candidatus Pacearchaeota archaeon CG1_02_35_32]PIO07237.1 MAG: hypothetical protein COU62_04420 [Candidatus Pacearchaeota archaeon CG10_big_fil_rev_8_21_14_0_10_35_219]PIY81194.1 MAG: hypothetical protein COY79_04090 [Candidatus Pacearchaeota archaeon CG_4_10_14_0_8_um_filter_35_169]PIZ79445.1 MAG: hypothetical protein COY00_04100 [Candidatus Pacearchaeota archaeon CG_4_10_14_0_2_um_filter_35
MAKRTNKFLYPNSLCFPVGGGIEKDETAEAAAKREMKEEIGIIFPIIKIFGLEFDSKEIYRKITLFITKKEIKISGLKPDPDEIQYLKEFTIEEIKQMIKEIPEDWASTAIATFNEFLGKSE